MKYHNLGKGVPPMPFSWYRTFAGMAITSVGAGFTLFPDARETAEAWPVLERIPPEQLPLLGVIALLFGAQQTAEGTPSLAAKNGKLAGFGWSLVDLLPSALVVLVCNLMGKYMAVASGQMGAWEAVTVVAILSLLLLLGVAAVYGLYSQLWLLKFRQAPWIRRASGGASGTSQSSSKDASQ